MLKIDLFPLAWSFLASLANAVCFVIWVFLHDLDFLVLQIIGPAALSTHLGNVLSAQLTAWVRKEKTQTQWSPSLLWTWELNLGITTFAAFMKLWISNGDFYRKELSCSLPANPSSFPYQNFKVGWSARRLCQQQTGAPGLNGEECA